MRFDSLSGRRSGEDGGGGGGGGGRRNRPLRFLSIDRRGFLSLGFGARKGKMTRRSKAADGDPPRPREAFARRVARALQPSPVRSRPRGRTSS